MPVNFFQRRKILKGANYLDLTPCRVHESETDENGLVTVLIRKFTNPIAQKLLEPTMKSKYIKIKLDEIGSAAWTETDGKSNVRSIAARLVEKFGDRIAPVEERLTKFYTGLYIQNMISFNEIKKEGE